MFKLLPRPKPQVAHIGGRGAFPLDRNLEGKTVLLAVKLRFAGASISTIVVGEHPVQIINSSLRKAEGLADEILYFEDV